MKPFDPFTATLEEAKAQPDASGPLGTIVRWSVANMITENRATFEHN